MYPRSLTRPKRRRRLRRWQLAITALIIIATGAYAAIAITRPFAELTPNQTTNNLSITTPDSNLPWPSYGQGAFGLASGKVIATNGEQTPAPIASVTKTITALVILERHPIAAGGNGPIYTMTEKDVDLYRRYVSINGSVMPVRVGQQLTLKQMLQALMLPSANNIADGLAIWSFGSIDKYVAYANDYLQRKGLTETKVGGDASGYLPDSASSARDLVKLGALAVQHPVLAEVINQKTAVIPDVGTVRNYNSLLGTNGINGVKTGNNDENGGVFVGSTTTTVNGKPVTLITALSGAPTLGQVLRDSGTLLAAVRTTFADTIIIKKDAVLGTYNLPNGTRIQAVAADDLSTTVLRGDSAQATVKLNNISYDAAVGDRVGTATTTATDFADARSIPIVLKQAPVKPDIWYRLVHP